MALEIDSSIQYDHSIQEGYTGRREISTIIYRETSELNCSIQTAVYKKYRHSETSETDNSMTARHSDRLYYTRRPQRFTLIFKKSSKCDSNIQKDLGVILKCHRSTALYREFN